MNLIQINSLAFAKIFRIKSRVCPECAETGEKSTVTLVNCGQSFKNASFGLYWDESGEVCVNSDDLVNVANFECSKGHAWSEIL